MTPILTPIPEWIIIPDPAQIARAAGVRPVSYTHLTLPTTREV